MTQKTLNFYVSLLLTAFALLGCEDPISQLLKSKEIVDIVVKTSKPTGRYLTIPSSIKLTFPDTVDIGSIGEDDFFISDTCANGNAEVDSVSSIKTETTITLAGVGTCLNGETVTLIMRYQGIELLSDEQKVVGKKSFVFTVDNVIPSVSAAIKNVSSITTSGTHAFSSQVSTVIYSFSDDTNLASITTTDFVIAAGAGSSCSTLPTLSSLTKAAATSSVTVNLTGAVCADGEAFKITLKANAASDKTLSPVTGESLPNTAPLAALELTLLYSVSVPSVESVGDGATSDSGLYAIGSPIDIIVKFTDSVDVTGVPRLRLNLAGTRYAYYISGSGSDELLFRYTVTLGAGSSDLEYLATSSLGLNGGNIFLTGSGGTVPANLTLPTPGAANSLSFLRDIELDVVPPVVSSSTPSGANYFWGTSEFEVSFVMSKEIDPATLADSDLVITSGTCLDVPTVESSALSGATDNVVTFALSQNNCADGTTFNLRFTPSDVSDLAGNLGSGSARNILITVGTSRPLISVGAPSKTVVNSSGQVEYVVTYSGATAITLTDSEVQLAGDSDDCTVSVLGSGNLTRTIRIENCSGNGSVQISLAEASATNIYANSAEAVDESEITDFAVDNLELPDPTDDLPIVGTEKVYNLTNLTSFSLEFSGDILGLVSSVSPTLSLSCDAGLGASPVSMNVVRTSDELLSLSPNEASPDFVYGATCEVAGVEVPDAAGNLHDFAPINFKVGDIPVILSGPPADLLLTAVEIDVVTFNVPVDVSTLTEPNVTFACQGNPIAISSVLTFNNDTEVTVDFDETDSNWQALSGRKSCTLIFTTGVLNSVGEPLETNVQFDLSTKP